MPWFSIKDDVANEFILYGESQHAIRFDFLKKGKWNLTISKCPIKALNYKSLYSFLSEFQHALDNGLQINEALISLCNQTNDKQISLTAKALISEIGAGENFNKTLVRLSSSQCKPYCQIISADGSREDCEKSLSTSINQLALLLTWSKKLLKSIIYPFFIIQVSLLLNMLHLFLTKTHDTDDKALLVGMGSYLLTSLFQLLIIISLYHGRAVHYLEKHCSSFRLTKLLVLLNTNRQTGKTLQQALIAMPPYFSHTGLKEDIFQSFYHLTLGKSYHDSLPSSWFPHDSQTALQAANKNGNIERAISLAISHHEKVSLKIIFWIEKIVPAICLFIAGSYAASTLLEIYQPLLELP